MIKQAIIVPTCKKFKPWLDNFMKTINTEYPIIIVYNTKENNMYDVLGVTTAIDLGIEEFFVMHDTMEVKDNSLFDILFKEHKGKTVFLNPVGQMFLNKYVLKDILESGVDYKRLYTVKNKLNAVHAESGFNGSLKQKIKPIILFPNFVDGPKREQKFGRNNMVIENQYLKKYKGTYSLAGIEKVDEYNPIQE